MLANEKNEKLDDDEGQSPFEDPQDTQPRVADAQALWQKKWCDVYFDTESGSPETRNDCELIRDGSAIVQRKIDTVGIDVNRLKRRCSKTNSKHGSNRPRMSMNSFVD
jgi:hypothetical protein